MARAEKSYELQAPCENVLVHWKGSSTVKPDTETLAALRHELEEIKRVMERNRKSVEWADETRLRLAKELGCVGTASEVIEAVRKLRAENTALREAAELEKRNDL